MSVIDAKVSRRTVIRTMLGAGGGMILGFHVPGAAAAVVAPKPWTTPTDGVEINAWLTIEADGTVTIRVPHTEQGQGALTSVSMMIAEELNVPWDSVRAVFADMNRHVNEGREYIVTSTHGSQLVRSQHRHIMQAGASARERLKQAAAEAWGIDRSEIKAHQGTLAARDHKATYAEFATAAAVVALDREPAIKKPGQWWLMGTEVPRLDVPVKVNGSAHYAIDTRLDGMVYAAVKNCPVPWGRLVSYDSDSVKNRRGVIAVIEFRAEDYKTGPNHGSRWSRIAGIAPIPRSISFRSNGISAPKVRSATRARRRKRKRCGRSLETSATRKAATRSVSSPHRTRWSVPNIIAPMRPMPAWSRSTQP